MLLLIILYWRLDMLPFSMGYKNPLSTDLFDEVNNSARILNFMHNFECRWIWYSTEIRSASLLKLENLVSASVRVTALACSTHSSFQINKLAEVHDQDTERPVF